MITVEVFLCCNASLFVGLSLHPTWIPPLLGCRRATTVRRSDEGCLEAHWLRYADKYATRGGAHRQSSRCSSKCCISLLSSSGQSLSRCFLLSPISFACLFGSRSPLVFSSVFCWAHNCCCCVWVVPVCFTICGLPHLIITSSGWHRGRRSFPQKYISNYFFIWRSFFPSRLFFNLCLRRKSHLFLHVIISKLKQLTS